MNNALTSSFAKHKNVWIFTALWLLTFVLYIGAAKAGWVIDAVGFLYNMKHQSFWDFINRANSVDKSFYQLFTLHYYIFYKIWGLNLWLWSMLYITVHAANAYLIYRFFSKLLADTGVAKNIIIPLTGAVIFTLSPHISEILICKAYYHYLQSFAFILLILIWAQKYQHNQRPRYIWYSLFTFIAASLTLEIFYLIPIFVLSLAWYYRFALSYKPAVFRKSILYFVVPQVLLLALYFVLLYTVFKVMKPHKIEINQTPIDYLSKMPKYLVHIAFFGRYYQLDIKKAVYTICESIPALVGFYTMLLGSLAYVALRIRKFGPSDKIIGILFIWSVITVAFLIPLPFPGPLLLVFYDRYTYFADPFIYTLLVMIVVRYFTNKYVLIGLFCIYIDFNLYYTIQLNTYWMDSDVINNKLLHHFPNPGNKTVLLLSMPENMEGAPMIGAQPEGMFKMMHEVFTDTVYNNKIYDVASYNMFADWNGAHVNVFNDTLIRVVLNHYGTWWWYEGHGAKSYETPDYSVNMRDPGHWYEISLKRPASEYLLLYSVGDKWKTVDMSKKNVNQD